MLSMANMAKQMELFDEGGLMQEGGTVDPVSGNDVPVGSTQEEVRDDIPAQLSEGEFVMPADVVRYHGLDKMMALRDEAKMGLQRMEAMGQMGNADEATIPDGVPFGMEDLEMEDDGQGELSFNVGGAVPMPGFTGIGGYTPPAPITTGFSPAPVVQQPVSAASSTQGQPVFTPTSIQQVMPSFQQTIGAGVPGVNFELVEYVNDAGQVIFLRKDTATGNLLDPVPQGYRPKTSTGGSTTTPGTSTVGTTAQDGGGDSDDDGPNVPSTTTTTGKGFKLGDLGFGNLSLSGIMGNTKSKTYNQAVTSLGLNQLASLSPMAALGSTVFGSVAPNTKAVMMNQSRVNAASIFGIDDINKATVSQLDDIGNIMKTANNFALKDNSLYNSIKTGTPAGVSKDRVDRAVATISGSLAEAVKSGIISSDDLAGIASLERDSKTGAYKSSSGKTVSERATVIGPDGRETSKNITIDKSVMDYVNAMLGTDDQMTPNEKQNARAATLEAAARDQVRSSTRVSDEPDPASEPPSNVSSTGDAGFSVTTGDDFGDDNFSTTSDPSVTATSRTTGESITTNYSQIPDELQTPSTSGESTSDNKIVCTAMNNAYGFGSFRQTVWLQHSKNMDPAYQKGYHRIFKPLIKFAYKDAAWYNMAIRNMLEGIARRRTADIWMQKHGKRHWHGAIERAILEPLCYIVGKIK